MSQANEKTMRRLVDEVINQQCLDVIDEIIHVDYVYRTPDQELHGRQALGELLTTYQTAFPDLQVNIDELITTTDTAVLIFTLTGTHENELMGIPPGGKQVNISGVIRSRFDNGQIIEEWELLDQLSLLQQLDVVPVN